VEQLLNFFADNKVATGIVSILTIVLGPAFVSKLNPLLSKVKGLLSKTKGVVSSFKSVAVSVDLEVADQNAIRHLRDRAAQFGDEVLVKEIKSIDSKFYDIHAKKGSITNG
jgi:hypothetical protein